MNQVNIGEDFEELLIDKIPDLPQQFVRSQRALLENAFIEFVGILCLSFRLFNSFFFLC